MATKYPIILVHGIVIKNFMFFRAFGHIEKALRKEGNVVFSSKIDGVGTIENNAKQLKKEILKILEKTGAEKVNIIAHSKGGLDSKKMIKELDMEDKVASLTTLCTPHKGSPIAANLLKLPKWWLLFINFWINVGYWFCGDKHPNALKACQDIAHSENTHEETIAFSKKVYCQSYYTKMDKIEDDFIMGIPLIFSRYYERLDTDGLVSSESAAFENFRGHATDIPLSHTEIVDFFPKKEKREKILIFYTELCRELAEMGY